MIWLVDDQHLGAFLRTGRRPRGVRRGDEIFTTGLWYFRLCQAALVAAGIDGVLSEPFAALDDDERERALRALVELPADVGLLSLRELSALMAPLRQRYGLNALASEVVAASSQLSSNVLIATSSPRLEAALAAEGVRCLIRPAA